MDAESIAIKARNIISEYCMNECSSYCCRKGTLTLEGYEVDLVVGDKKQTLLDDGFMEEEDTTYYLKLSMPGSCPSLDGTKCKIHSNPCRPKVCDQYPVFVRGDKIVLSSNCLAVRDGKLYSYIHQWKKLGLKVEY